MPVFQRPTINYYTLSKLSNGKAAVRHKDPDGNEHFHDGIEGILTKIDLVQDEYEGSKYFKYHFYFEDEAHTQTDILQVGESASAARGILMTLISCPDPIGWVKISPYLKTEGSNTYTNVWVEVDGQTVEWDKDILERIPGVRMVQLGDRKVPDDGARRKFFRKVAKRVSSQKLAGRATPPSSGQHPQPDGDRQAQRLYNQNTTTEEFEQPNPRRPETDLDGVDMDDWSKMDDDLPF